MKTRIYRIILFFLIATSTVYLLINSPQREFLHASSGETSTTRESEQSNMPLELTIVEGQVFKKGEPIELVGKLKNVSNEALVIRGAVKDWTLSVYLERKPEIGFQQTEPDGFISMPAPSLITLKPAEEYTFTVVFTPGLYSPLPGVGQYRVWMAYASEDPEVRSIWDVGNIRSPITTISIVE